MSGRDYVCIFQAIQFPYKDKPLRVLEEEYLGVSECTLNVARVMFKMRFEDKNYSRKYGAVWPDAVLFLDERREEILRYTAWDYLKDSAMQEGNSADET